MNLDMAIAATFVEDEAAAGRSQRIRIAMVKAVALPAKLRPLHLQQKLMGGAVRVVAIQAIFAHRRVLPNEWTPLLGMTLVAVIVHRIFAQHRFGGCAVWIMAVRTGDLAFAQWHVGREIILRAAIFVALVAGVRRESGLQLEFARHLFHDGVTVRAHKPAGLVRAAVPISPVSSLVAGETDGIVLLSRARWILRPE